MDSRASREDRFNWLRPETKVSDDPRRVPADPEADDAPEGSLVLKGGRIFDAVDGSIREGTVVIDRNKITDVVTEGDVELSEDVQAYDVSGKTVMPGLIDLHTHMTYRFPEMTDKEIQSTSHATLRAVDRIRFFLKSGITSMRDAGSHYDIPFNLKKWIKTDRVRGPRIFAAGCLITGTGGHGAEQLTSVSDRVGKIREAAGPDDWREAVREQFKKGADVIKVASHFSKEELRAAVEEAHALGLKVMCDAETFYVDWAVQAGVDTIEHPLPRTDEAIHAMVENQVASVATLVPYLIIFDEYGGYFGSTSRRFSFSKEDNLKLVSKMREAGVKIGVGTDLIMDWFRCMPIPYISELKQFVEAGFSRSEALMAATKTSAEILDMGDRLGTIEEGKLADIVVVDGCPDKDLDDLRSVDLVVVNGRMVVKDGKIEMAQPVTEEYPHGHGDEIGLS